MEKILQKGRICTNTTNSEKWVRFTSISSSTFCHTDILTLSSALHSWCVLNVWF